MSSNVFICIFTSLRSLLCTSLLPSSSSQRRANGDLRNPKDRNHRLRTFRPVPRSHNDQARPCSDRHIPVRSFPSLLPARHPILQVSKPVPLPLPTPIGTLTSFLSPNLQRLRWVLCIWQRGDCAVHFDSFHRWRPVFHSRRRFTETETLCRRLVGEGASERAAVAGFAGGGGLALYSSDVRTGEWARRMGWLTLCLRSSQSSKSRSLR